MDNPKEEEEEADNFSDTLPPPLILPHLFLCHLLFQLLWGRVRDLISRVLRSCRVLRYLFDEPI